MLSSLLSCQALAATTDQMLRHADNYRLQEGSARVMTVVRLYKNQVLDKTHLYEVYARPDRQSLVLFKSRTEAGQKLLMLGDNYWLLMPKSRRPIRITPMQKLLGEASVGDISSLRWRDDYQATLTGPATLTLNGRSVKANQLALVSKTKGASYARITLWLDQANDFPLKADLYLRSGKLAKQAFFSSKGTAEADDQQPLMVKTMTLLDKIQPAKKTVIEYQDRTPYQLADKYYNPAYLIRQAKVDL
ncbi:outer membrane lipoprotein-sorting protein [Vibrio quintilis]|nr:outer membrane lipoprotein-sorting protein [Vibrio quintilis]